MLSVRFCHNLTSAALSFVVQLASSVVQLVLLHVIVRELSSSTTTTRLTVIAERKLSGMQQCFVYKKIPFNCLPSLSSFAPQTSMMAGEYSSKPQYKTRSASISAPTSSSLEAIINAAEIEMPEVSTPNNRRRRPATRSQSARITGAKSVN